VIGDPDEARVCSGESAFPWVFDTRAASKVEEIVKELKIP
jgi:hypothetical protein